MRRKMIASLAVMSICFCSCQGSTSKDSPKATTVLTATPISTPDTQATTTPETGATPTPETKATNTPKAEPSKTATPPKAPTSSPTIKNEKLSLTAKIDLKKFKNVKELSLADEVNADFVLHSDTTLKDVTVSCVDNDLQTCKITKKVYEKSQFTNADAIHIKTYLPELCSNLLVTYKTSNNKIVYKLVGYNMKDGTVELQDVDPKIIQSK